MTRFLAVFTGLLLISLPLWSGASRDFDSSNDIIDYGDHGDFSMNDDSSTDYAASFAFWFVATDTTDIRLGPQKMIAWGSEQANSEYQMGLIDASDNLQFVFYDRTSSCTGTSTWIRVLINIGTTYDGAWTHIAGTYDGSESNTGMELYINGAIQSVSRDSSGVYGHGWNCAPEMTIGAAYTTSAINDSLGVNGGSMAHFHLYKQKELTEAEVKQVMRCPGSIVDGLVVYSPLMGVDSTTYEDYSGSDHDGGIGNGTATAEDSDGPPVSLSCAGGN
ncbi:MAG: LamG-like jellyroll fold domain-containing protein [Planctomycetota bacterium]